MHRLKGLQLETKGATRLKLVFPSLRPDIKKGKTMTAQNLFSMILNISNIMKELETAGVRLEIGSDFAAFKKVRRTHAERAHIYPMFDVSSSFVDSTNAFWVCGFNDKNELVHTQAIRMFDLGDVKLADHLRDHRHKYITPGTTCDPDETYFSPLPILDRITGRACYHGEFWLRGGEGGHRAQGFTALLSRVVFEIALRTWSPDFVFGFVPIGLSMKGITVRYGYAHCEPGAWIGPDGEVTSEEFLVWMSRNDMEQAMTLPPRTLSADRSLTDVRRRLAGVSAVA